MTVTLKNLKATNTLTYKELNVPLDNQGLVLITAKNNDASGSNGSGKSNIWEMLCHLIFGKTGKGLKDKGLVNQFVGKDMLIELDLEVNGTPYLFRETRKHDEHGTGFLILEDGNDITPKRSSGKSEPQLRMQEIIGFSLQEYLGLVYLCQKYNHVLVKGTRSEKQAYLSALFDLDKYDVLHKEAKERSKKVEKDIVGFQSYDRDLERCEEALSTLPKLSTTKKKLKKAKKTLEEQKKQRQSLTQEITQLQDSLQQVKRKEAALKGLESINFKNVTEKVFQEERAEVEANLEKTNQAIRSLELMLEKLRQRETIQSQLPEAPSLSKESLLSTISTLRQEIPNQQLLLQQLNERASLTTTLEGVRATLEKEPSLEQLDQNILDTQSFSDEMKSKLTDVEYALRKARDAQSSLEAITGSTCPTCHRDLSSEEKDLLIQGLGLQEKEISWKKVGGAHQILVDQLNVLQQQRVKVAQVRQEEAGLLDRLASLPSDDSDVVHSALQRNIEALQRAESSLQVWTTREALESQLATLPEGDISMNEGVLADFLEKRDIFKNRGAILNQAAMWIRDANLDIGILEVSEADLQEKKDSLDSLTQDIESLIQEQTILTNQLQERQDLEEEKKAAEVMLKEAEVLRPRQIYLPKLVDAFGPKGLKMVRLDLVMQQIVKILPHYLGPLFSGSGYKVSVGKSLDFELAMLHEGKRVVLPGKGTSGGEAKVLDMATLFALRTLRTSNKSANILIVDEPYGDLDAGKRGVLTDLFQQLRTTEAVNSVFVITHEAEVLQQSFDKVWTVVRENNESKLLV